MSRPLRLLLPVALTGLLSLGLVACGGEDNEIPGNAVARVGDATVTKEDFEHWLDVSVAQAGPNGGRLELGTPPDFAACVAQRKEQAPDPGKGQPTTSDEQYREQCEQQYEAARDQVMQFLLSAEWIEQEAAERDISVSDEELQKELEQTKEQSFPKERDYQKFLKSSGMTEDDVLFRIRLDTLSNKLREAVTKGEGEVTEAQVTEYYNENKERFATPETRDVRIVLTKTKTAAEAAKRALSSGDSWDAVAQEFSIDQATKGQGGLLAGISEGQQEKALDEAIFSADKGEVLGPVKTQFGWYVFEVEKVTKASQQTQEESTETIKQLLKAENEQTALDEFVKGFEEQWTAATDCREGYIVASCSNYEEPETTATTPAGGMPTPTTPAE